MPFPKNRLRPARLATLAALATAAFASGSVQAQNILPTNGVVVTPNSASISQSGSNLSVTQSSQRAIINWGSFSIGQSNSVSFHQPNASSAILNRVTGSTTSTIAGQLTANGQVYLVNPNGIAITPTGSVRVGGGFVASTLGIEDSDFLNGNLNFVGHGASAGVDNAGSIEAGSGGFVGLIGGTVSNSGVVTVPLGKVAMGSGEQATLNLTGDNFLQVAVPTNTKTADGKALIDVSGKVIAAGGSVQLKAATIAQAIRNAVNVPGELTVASARASGGSIILSGGPGGDVAVSGKLTASGLGKGGTIAVSGHNAKLNHARLVASGANGRGGSVTVTGTNAVALASTAIDASGATGGGAIRIGGDFHGASDLTSARTTTIDSASTLNASATGSGNGGTVAVWSDATTTFAGRIAAKGGPDGGNGGYVEVSANPATHGVLDFTGSADLTAAKGVTGTLLLDPYDVEISYSTDSGGSFSGGVYTPTTTSVIYYGTLENQLALSNVIISTGSTGPSTGGNITVSAPVTWATSTSLTLEAAQGIYINAPITATGAGSSIKLIAGGDIIEGSIPDVSDGSIEAPALSATSSTGRVVLTFSNTVGSVSGSAPGGFSFLNTGALDVGSAGITSSGGSIALETITGSITQTGPLKGVALFANAGSDGTGDVILNNANNAIGTLAGAASGSFQFANGAGAGLTIGSVNYFVSSGTSVPDTSTGAGVTSFASSVSGAEIQISTAGNLTLNSSVVGSISDGLIILAATGNFINNVGPGAVTDPWQIYSASPTGDFFNGLDSGNTAVWNTTFGQPVTASGNRYIFAFQPTITVTSISDSKTYGQDVTSRVATDYIISGLQPADPSGAYLGDSASAVYSGTPLVTSLGSLAGASVAGGPYAITVAQGTFTVSDGYALVLDSAGLLTVDPLALTYAVADATSTYGTTPTLGAATLFGVLPGDTVDATVGVFSGTTQVTVGSRTPAGVYSEEVTGLSNSNYTIAASGNTPGTLTIDPKTVTYSVADASSVYGVTAILGAATLYGVLSGDVVDATVSAFSGSTQVVLNPFTPVGRYAELVTALSNPNYRIASGPNFPGVLTITGRFDPGFLPGLTQINNPAPSEYDVGGFEQVLPQFTVNCNEPPSLPDPNRYADPDEALRAISHAVDAYFKRCQNPTQETIANALEAYAAKLQVLAPRLPPALRNVPAIIAESARRVRAARSRTEAVAILRQTVAAVHKQIALVLSEDPQTRSRELRDGEVIEGALGAASVALVNSGGL